MKQPIYVVDAFTDRPFAGNPAAVCPLEAPRDERWMQAVAAEMNLSITAFPERRGEVWSLRWFTRKTEIDLCGHGTLASAHLLWETGALEKSAHARFDTRSGRVTVRRAGGAIGAIGARGGIGASGAMEMDFPERRESVHQPLPELFAALGATPAYFGKNAYDYFAVYDREEEVRQLTPDLAALRRLPVRGVIVTAAADKGSEVDFVSRFFAPGVGIDEDPVTGSAHCCLAPYWCEKLGRQELVGYQASERGGVVRVRVEGDRVHLGGRAVTVLAGELVEPG